MDVTSFLIIFSVCLACMLACRCLPIFLLKGKQLPERFVRALNFIPPAAFAALVTNDLFDSAKVASGDIALWGMPLLAAAVVLVVGAKTKSMAACIVVGVGMLAVLTYVPALL